MKKENYFVGVRFDKDKQLFHKLNENPLPNSVIVRKALNQYFRAKEENQTLHMNQSNRELIDSLTSQIGFLQSQIDFLHNQNAFLSLPWYKKVIYQLEKKRE